MKSLRTGCDDGMNMIMDKLLVMVTARILREVEREIPEIGGGRICYAVSFLFFIDKNDYYSFTAVKSC